MHRTRRDILATLLAVPPALLTGGGGRADGQVRPLPLTPACGEAAEATPRQTAGPYYRPGAPLRRNLAANASGGRAMTLAGFVVDPECRPIRGATVEIWHADGNGDYDNVGFDLRGSQRTDDRGRWGFSTIVTQHYSFCTAHYHFRLETPGGAALTTQLYIPDHPLNARDRLFDARLVLDVADMNAGRVGRFTFVLRA